MPRLAPPILTLLALLALSALLEGRLAAGGPHRAYLPSVSCPTCQGAGQPIDRSTWEARFIQLVNQRRAEAGCPAVTGNTALSHGVRSIADTWKGGLYWSRAIYREHGYSGAVLDAAEHRSRAATPEQALARFEEQWGVLNEQEDAVIPSRMLRACHLAGSPAATYDLGVAVGDEWVIVALADSFAEARMVELVNQARAAAGCPAATPSSTLMQATGDWSVYMQAHNIGEHAPSNWYTEPPYLYPTNAVLENIAGGADSAESIFAGWMGSPLHRRNLEWCYYPDNPSYHEAIYYEVGVGFAGGYWTLALADRDP